MNRMLTGMRGLGTVPELHDSVAFEKGIEWFTEIFVFYGTLAVLAIYEMDRTERLRLKQVADI